MANWGTLTSKLKAVEGGIDTNNEGELFAIGHTIYDPINYKIDFEYQGDYIRFPNPAYDVSIRYYFESKHYAVWNLNHYEFPSPDHKPYIVGQRTYENDPNTYYDGFLLITNRQGPTSVSDVSHFQMGTWTYSNGVWTPLENVGSLTSSFYNLCELMGWYGYGVSVDTDKYVGCQYVYGGITNSDYTSNHMALIFSGREPNQPFIDGSRLPSGNLSFANYFKIYRKVNGLETLVDYSETTLEKIVSSEEDGGKGTFDNDSDTIDFAQLPAVDVVDCGFITLYKPTLSDIKEFAGWLWSDNFFDNLDKIWSDPLDMIITLNILPIQLVGGNTVNIHLGNLNTGVSCQKLNSQYVSFDCGELSLKEYFGSSLDYNPYTAPINLWLPYVGFVNLDTDSVMDGKIRVQYNIDILTGSFAVMVKSIRHGLSSVLYHFQGNMATVIPLTSRDSKNIYQSVLNIGSSVIGGALSGGVGGAISSGVLATADETLSKKTNVQKSNSASGPSGFMDILKPYVIIERPIQSLASGFAHQNGYPSNITSRLGALKGYTEIESVEIKNINAHSDELELIETLLKNGVYL